MKFLEPIKNETIFCKFEFSSNLSAFKIYFSLGNILLNQIGININMNLKIENVLIVMIAIGLYNNVYKY